MLTPRQATLDDLEALVQLRLKLLREVGNPKDDADTAALAKAIQQYQRYQRVNSWLGWLR